MKNVRGSQVQERLAKAVAYLDRLDVDRISHGDPNLGGPIEKRIIWRELLDLELQEFDAEIERLSEVAHTLVPDAGAVMHDSSDMQQIHQPPQGDIPAEPWWGRKRFFS